MTVYHLLIAETFYADQHHPYGSDTNPGTEALPFETVQIGMTTAGFRDIIYIKAGNNIDTVIIGNPGEIDTHGILAYRDSRQIANKHLYYHLQNTIWPANTKDHFPQLRSSC